MQKKKSLPFFFFYYQSLVYQWIWDDWLMPVSHFPNKTIVSKIFRFKSVQMGIINNWQSLPLSESHSCGTSWALSLSLSLTLYIYISLSHIFYLMTLVFFYMLFIIIKIFVKIINPGFIMWKRQEEKGVYFFLCFHSFSCFFACHYIFW